MKGQHDITVRIPGAVYKIHVRRNITVLRGNSGTGKSTLVKAIYDINNTKLAGQNQTEAVIECNVPVRAIIGNDFEYASFQLSKIQNSIVFIDEDQQWIQSEDFARIVKGSQNYWVLVQRDRLQQLSYSIKEIYELRELDDHEKQLKYPTIKSVVNYNQQAIASNDGTVKEIKHKYTPDKLIIEDSKSGLELYRALTSKECISQFGKLTIVQTIRHQNKELRLLAVVDGAAFGCHYEELKTVMHLRPMTAVYFPEQTEWLILKSGVIADNKVRKQIEAVVNSPWDHIDSSYMSWELYFDEFIEKVTKDIPYARYNKSKLADFYKQEHNLNKIRSTIPENIGI